MLGREERVSRKAMACRSGGGMGRETLYWCTAAVDGHCSNRERPLW